MLHDLSGFISSGETETLSGLNASGCWNIAKFQANLGESGGILTLVCVFIILLENPYLGEPYYLYFNISPTNQIWTKIVDFAHRNQGKPTNNMEKTWIHPWSLTAPPWKMLVGRRSFPYREDIFFRGRAAKLWRWGGGVVVKNQSAVLPQICTCKSCGESHHHLVILQHLSTAKDVRHHHGFRSESLTFSIITITA